MDMLDTMTRLPIYNEGRELSIRIHQTILIQMFWKSILSSWIIAKRID